MHPSQRGQETLPVVLAGAAPRSRVAVESGARLRLTAPSAIRTLLAEALPPLRCAPRKL